MPGMDGIGLQRRVRETNPELVVILVTAYASVATAVQALKEGAYDYLVKPFDPADMSRVVEKACEKIRLEEENLALRRRLEESQGPEFVTGVSREMQRVIELVDSVAPTDTTVRVRGDSGTGKELVARLIHSRRQRARVPPVAVNVGPLPAPRCS